MNDGLADHELLLIQKALASVSQVESVVLYGSRALGTYRPGSDIDLAIEGTELTNEELARIAGRLDELPLPYRYDLTLRASISNPALRQHIDRFGVVFWQRRVPPNSTRQLTRKE